MDRQKWMYEARRTSKEYIDGVDEFMECALEDMRKKGAEQLLCPCVDCGNNKRHPNIEVKSHLIRRVSKENIQIGIGTERL